MAIAVQLDYTVDLCKPVHLIQMDVPFFTGDKNAHRFHVKLMRNGCDIDVSGLTATGYMVRADKQTVAWEGEVDGCDIYLTMPAACYAVAGRFRLLLRVTLGDTVETALWVEGAIRDSTTDVVVDPGEVVPSLDELLAQIAEMEAATAEAQAVIAEASGDLNTVNLWERGGIGASGNYGSTKMLRTKGYVPDNVKLIYCGKDYYFNVWVYDADGNYVGVWGGSTIGTSSKEMRYILPDGLAGYKLRIMLRRYNATTMDVSECSNVHFLPSTNAEAFYPTPTLTFIDDDGSLEALENWESIADEIGVKITACLVTGVMGDGETNPGKASWDDVARLQNKGFEFVSHTHGHIDVVEETEEVVEQDFKASIAALREHGCEPRYLVYPYNSITTARMPLVRKHFRAGVGLGSGWDNRLPLYTYHIRRYSINDTSATVEKEYNGEAVQAYAFHSLDTMKGYIDTAMANGAWIIIMTHLRNDDSFYHDDESRALIIDLCKYAIQKGMTIQTFGKAFERYANVLESGTTYDTTHYVVDCNNVPHYRGV